MAFEAIEARVNAAAIRKLANATATLNDQLAIRGVFVQSYIEPAGGMVEDAAPVFRCLAADALTLEQGDELGIDAQTIGVTGDYAARGIEPDGTGIVLVRLEKL